MIKNDDIMFIELENLNEKDCGKFIKSMMGVNIDSILGLDYIPQSSSPYLQGEPRNPTISPI